MEKIKEYLQNLVCDLTRESEFPNQHITRKRAREVLSKFRKMIPSIYAAVPGLMLTEIRLGYNDGGVFHIYLHVDGDPTTLEIKRLKDR